MIKVPQPSDPDLKLNTAKTISSSLSGPLEDYDISTSPSGNHVSVSTKHCYKIRFYNTNTKLDTFIAEQQKVNTEQQKVNTEQKKVIAEQDKTITILKKAEDQRQSAIQQLLLHSQLNIVVSKGKYTLSTHVRTVTNYVSLSSPVTKVAGKTPRGIEEPDGWNPLC